MVNPINSKNSFRVLGWMVAATAECLFLGGAKKGHKNMDAVFNLNTEIYKIKCFVEQLCCDREGICWRHFLNGTTIYYCIYR